MALGLYSSPSIDDTPRGQQYTYDLAGRRISMQWHLGTTNYVYNDFGALELITDPTNTIQARFTYYLDGSVDSLNLGTGVKEKRVYDNDGRLISKNRISTSGTLGTLVSDALTYDKMNRVIAVSEQVPQQGTEQTRISYDGLGAVLAKETSNGLGARVEEFRNDAFGNVVRRLTRRTAGLINDAPFAMQYTPMGELTSAFAQVSNPSGQNERRDQLIQQFASGGQLIRQDQIVENPNTGNTVELELAARHYYSADDRLMAVQRYSYRSPSVSDGTWEEYWYDALGRRVLTRARRDEGAIYPATFAHTLCMGTIQCRSFTERVWWDGDNALVEERTPEGTADASNSGLVGNINGPTIDEPLAVMADHIRIINYNWRGQGMSSVFLSGGAGDISLGNTSTEVDWPAATQAETYFAKSPDATPSNNAKRWLGTFVANGQGTTGILYRRNRYFDPKGGQFTQADPVGIAGGMNAFGFAAGDPINFNDPFGLCSKEDNWTKCPESPDQAAMQGPGLLDPIALLAGGVGAITKAAYARVLTKAVFWSGEGAEAAARQWAGANSGRTLEMTRAGKALGRSLKGIDFLQARPQWLKASLKFAEQAEGDVHVFHSAKGLSLKSIWREEYQALMANPRVDRIIYHVVH